jgi:hypothetical protein
LKAYQHVRNLPQYMHLNCACLMTFTYNVTWDSSFPIKVHEYKCKQLIQSKLL